MSGGTVCKCPEIKKPIGERKWAVVNRYHNRSAFNGYRFTPSDWSSVICCGCLARWPTKAAYVAQLPDAVISADGWEQKKMNSDTFTFRRTRYIDDSGGVRFYAYDGNLFIIRPGELLYPIAIKWAYRYRQGALRAS